MRYEIHVTSHYQSLKLALLKSFEFTSEGYKRKFKNSTLEKGETYQLNGTWLKGYLGKWVQMSETEQSYEGLSESLLVDQLMEGASEGLRYF